MNANALEIEEAARLWAIRVQDPGFADWDGFTEWLERDPRHLAAYEAALEQGEWAAELLASAPAPDREPQAQERPHRRRWFAAGTAVAAALAGVAGWSLLDGGAPPELIATAPGEHRTIDLADGSRILLNGGTRVTIDRDSPRRVELAQGEALFEVRHDARNPFVVVSGDTRLLDAGTVFNVVAEGGALDVAVAEGAVIYQPGPRQVRLDAGDALSRASAGAVPVLRKTSPQGVGSWRSGALQYDGAPLDQVARDLARNLGRPVRAARGTEDIRFTGTLVLAGAPEEVLARAAPLLGVRFQSNGEGWTMSIADGSPP